MTSNDPNNPRNGQDPHEDFDDNQGPDTGKLEQLYDSRVANRRTTILTIVIILAALLLVGVIFAFFILPRIRDDGPGDETTTRLTTTQPTSADLELTTTSERPTTESMTWATTSTSLTETSSAAPPTTETTTEQTEATTTETTTTETTTTEETTTEETTTEETTTEAAVTDPVNVFNPDTDFGLWANDQARLFTSADVNLRAEPDANADVITVIPSGSEIELIEQLDGWKEIRYGSNSGFIMDRFAETFAYNTSPEDRSYYILTDTQLLAEADPGADVLAQLPANTPVEVLSRNLSTGWHRIRAAGKTGHVPAQVITYTMNSQAPGWRADVTEADLVGIWDKRVFDKSQPDMTLGFNQVLELRADGTFTYTHMQLHSEGYSYGGLWKLSGGLLTLTDMELPVSELFEIDPDAYPNHTRVVLGADGNSLYLASSGGGDAGQVLVENTPYLRAG